VDFEFHASALEHGDGAGGKLSWLATGGCGGPILSRCQIEP
jgi:hypothetical protein